MLLQRQRGESPQRMIRLTILLTAALFAAFYIFGRDLTPEERAQYAPAAGVSDGQSPALADETGAPILDPSKTPDFTPITQSRVIAEETPTRPVVPNTPLDKPTPNPNAEADPDAVPLDDGQVAEDPAPQVEPQTWYVVGDQVNVRAGQGTEFPVVTQVYYAEPVTVMTNPDAEWVQIKLSDGTEAWLAARFLSPVQPQ
jgi:uncharacterized protein YgiM (DUF1202 family)